MPAVPPREFPATSNPDPRLSGLLVDTIKTLAIDAVQKANSGHPGMPMGAAVMGSVLWTRFLVHDPEHPRWPDRDRFVLSAGHGSMLLYALLHLTGYDLPLEELKHFRQWGSKTPGHPEYGHTVGVEVTTGPLGTGFAAAVGMALAERFLAATYNRPGHDIVDHFTYGICSDGDLMEGIASEAASLAGHLGLGKLVFLYDDNKISIDGSTDLAFTEDVLGRFAAYGWHVQRIDGADAAQVEAALVLARAETTRPSLIACRTVIAAGSPNKAGTHGAHGAPLGDAEVAATKKAMGWPEDQFFRVPDEVRAALTEQRRALGEQRKAWEAKFDAYRKAHPELAAQFEALQSDVVPEEVLRAIPSFEPGTAVATRKAGQKILEALVKAHPTLIGGSADLAGSNGVELKLPAQSRTRPDGRVMHFGVREHGMAGVCNGLALHGGVRAYGATFLVFSDFLRGALRLSSLMRAPVVYIFSHDSFWVGEDGPTHQPIEQLMSLRLIPDLYVVRPADARETAAAWRLALQRGHADGATAILLTRQDLPIMAETREQIDEGAYVLWQPEGPLDGILVATGSEVATALAAARTLHADHGKRVRVVSMPCWEAFLAQPKAYQDSVLPPEISRRLSVEAGTTFGWDRFAAHQHGLDHYGASAPGKLLAERFGFTPAAVVKHWLELP
ncbi:transketolase [Nannocystis punicea]|uniref:Transketolase n=1 Tax=Nannocystis punicea TaxID=2995304 RepID=A0ABY7H7K0_9BACT|nr:transketolase [Nannocystis poenicansa]WAS95148.1 transketolase [Nannocystis poenicansa]